MNKFFCKGKCTVTVVFKNNPLRVDVVNDKNKIYFFRELGGKFKTISFNICHKGHYKISDDCESIEVNPIKIIPITITLPPPDRNREKPISFEYNDNLITTPARINTGTGRIELGRNFKKYPFPVRLFILCHEQGHFFYSKEEDADLYACKIYVNNGYNKSNALYSLTKVLHAGVKNKKRISELFKTLQT